MEIYKNLSLDNLENEIWKPFKNFELAYHISNMGRIKSLIKKRRTSETIIKQAFNEKGYLQAFFSDNGKKKCVRIHRHVALHFIHNPYNLKEVNHKNGIKTDNRASELEWVSHIDNMRHAFSTGLCNLSNAHKRSPVNQLTINYKLIKKWDSMADIERELKIDHGGISRCCRGESSQSNGFRWEYAN